MQKKVTTVLLDIDGTLIDSNDAHAKSWLQALTTSGFQTDYETIRKKIGMGGDKLLPAVIGIESDSDVGKKLSELRGKIFNEKYLPTLNAFAKTKDLLQLMLQSGLQLVVATSATKDDLTALLDQTGLSDLLQHRVTSEDVENSKPDPDILEAALKRMKVSADNAVMIGDTPYDLQAAKRAHIKSIGFTSGGWNLESLHDAIAVYEGPAELLQCFRTSPLSN